MAVRDLAAYLDDDDLVVPVGGNTYRIPSPDAETGLYLAGLAQLGTKAYAGGDVTEDELDSLNLDDDDERDLMQKVLGSAYDEMRADNVSWVRLQRISRYAFLYFAVSPEAADEAARKATDDLGETPAPNRASRRAATKSPKVSSATAKRKPARGSTAGSKSSPHKAS